MGCQGCKTKIDCTFYTRINKCIIKHNAPKRKCPCQSCVIKPMCRTQCKPFYNLAASIFKMKLSYDYKGVVQQPNVFNGNPTTARPYYNRVGI